MKFKFLTGIGLIALFGSVAIAFQSREPPTIKVVLNQRAEDGIAPIEIIQPAFVSSAPNKLDDLTYIIRNNSDRALVAAAVVKTIIYELNGKAHADSVLSTMDSAFHPDMPGKPVSPESQTSMQSPGPVTYSEGVVIKEITLKLEYGSFDDNSAYGSGSEGERQINGVREGARRYKSWLVEEYSRAGNAFTTIFPLIQSPDIPLSLKLDSYQTMGANRYRLQLLSTLRKKGAADVESYLKQNQ